LPRDLQTFTNCAGPGRAIPHDRIGLRAPVVGAFIDAWETGILGVIAAVGLLLLTIYFTVLALVAAIPGGGGFVAAWAWVIFIMLQLEVLRIWYYNWRLLCVGDDDECLIGTVLSEPSVSFWDGDRKLNLIAAPFIRDELIEMLVVHLDANRDLLTDPSLPQFPPTGFNVASPLDSDLVSLWHYMDDLAEADAQLSDQIQIGVVARLMSNANTSTFFPGEPKNLFNRLYRKDTAFIPEDSSLWRAIPNDNDPAIDWEQPNQRSNMLLNPMFRFDSKNLASYVHCEIEGDRFSDIITAINNALMAALLALTIVAALAGWGWGALAGFIALVVIAVLSYLLGEALWGSTPEEPDIDWDDDDADQDGIPDRQGDLVVVRGRWIMDTEHGNYFEIHPVRAYYLVARGSLTEPEVIEPDRSIESFDPRLISRARAANICGMIDPSEDEDLPDSVELTLPQSLSYGLNTSYSGGGLAAS
jgi:hypothetical protein